MNRIVIVAKNIAIEAHKGQFRRDGTTPYIKHPRDVAQRVGAAGHCEAAVAAAWLHDVLEDTDVKTEDLIAAGIPQIVISAVWVLTKDENATYMENMGRIQWAQPAFARHVKVHDLLSNISDTPTDFQIRRYSKALALLTYRYGQTNA
jgi:(p)ppGpp synthase/HD superfamily hydrolase